MMDGFGPAGEVTLAPIYKQCLGTRTRLITWPDWICLLSISSSPAALPGCPPLLPLPGRHIPTGTTSPADNPTNRTAIAHHHPWWHPPCPALVGISNHGRSTTHPQVIHIHPCMALFRLRPLLLALRETWRLLLPACCWWFGCTIGLPARHHCIGNLTTASATSRNPWWCRWPRLIMTTG
jgi:hypothetical protein